MATAAENFKEAVKAQYLLEGYSGALKFLVGHDYTNDDAIKYMEDNFQIMRANTYDWTVSGSSSGQSEVIVDYGYTSPVGMKKKKRGWLSRIFNM